MAGKQGSGQFAVLLIDGYNMLAAKVQGFSWKKTVELEKSDGLGDEWAEHTPTGMRSAIVKQTGAFFDTATNSIHTAFRAAASAVRVVCFAPAGNTIGAPFVGCEGAYNQSYQAAPSLGKLTKADAEYAVSGKIEDGAIIQHHATKTADWNTKTDGASVDFALDPSQVVTPISTASKAASCVVTTTVPHNLSTGHVILISDNTLSGPSINSEKTVTVTSETTFTIATDTSGSSGAGTGGSFVRCNSLAGGVGYQQVSEYSGFTGLATKFRDSADNTTFADLLAMSNVTSGPAAERAEVSGTIDRYLCFDGDVAGSGSIKIFAGFVRK